MPRPSRAGRRTASPKAGRADRARPQSTSSVCGIWRWIPSCTLEWIVLDLVPLQYHAGKVLPVLVRNPYGADVFPGTIRSGTVVHHPEKKSEHGRPLVHLTMNQNTHRAGLPEYVAEQVEIFVAGTMPIHGNVQ